MKRSEIEEVFREYLDDDSLSFCGATWFGNWSIAIDEEHGNVDACLDGRIFMAMPFESIEQIKYKTEHHYNSNDVSSLYYGSTDTLLFCMDNGAVMSLDRNYIEEGRF